MSLSIGNTTQSSNCPKRILSGSIAYLGSQYTTQIKDKLRSVISINMGPAHVPDNSEEGRRQPYKVAVSQ